MIAAAYGPLCGSTHGPRRPAARLPADSRYKTLLFAVMMFNP